MTDFEQIQFFEFHHVDCLHLSEFVRVSSFHRNSEHVTFKNSGEARRGVSWGPDGRLKLVDFFDIDF